MMSLVNVNCLWLIYAPFGFKLVSNYTNHFFFLVCASWHNHETQLWTHHSPILKFSHLFLWELGNAFWVCILLQNLKINIMFYPWYHLTNIKVCHITKYMILLVKIHLDMAINSQVVLNFDLLANLNIIISFWIILSLC